MNPLIFSLVCLVLVGISANLLKIIKENKILLYISLIPCVYLLIRNIMLRLVGMFMESMAAILILVPVLMPIAIDFGIDPVHFALVVVMNFAIGMVTPPYGITLFVASAIAERNVLQVARKMFWPWLIMTTTLVIVTYFPSFGLYLPRLSGLLD